MRAPKRRLFCDRIRADPLVLVGPELVLDSESIRRHFLGWCTLILDPESVHGDAQIVGPHLMAMTSNHKTMETADTVFLKHAKTGCNMRVLPQKPAYFPLLGLQPTPPYVDHSFVWWWSWCHKHQTRTQESRNDAIQYHSLVLHPFSYGFWKAWWQKLFCWIKIQEKS